MRAKVQAVQNPRSERLIQAAIGAAVLATLIVGVAYARQMAQSVAVASPVKIAKIAKQIPLPDIPGATGCGDQHVRLCSEARKPRMRPTLWLGYSHPDAPARFEAAGSGEVDRRAGRHYRSRLSYQTPSCRPTQQRPPAES